MGCSMNGTENGIVYNFFINKGYVGEDGYP
jgi:hypothetical protein